MWRHPCLLDFSSTGVYAHKIITRNVMFSLIEISAPFWFTGKITPQKMTCKWCGRIVKRFFTLSIGNIIFPNRKAKCCFSSEICAIFIWKILVVQKRQVEEGNKVQWTAAGHVITPPVLMIYWGPSASHLMLLYYIWWHIISTERQENKVEGGSDSFGSCRMMSTFTNKIKCTGLEMSHEIETAWEVGYPGSLLFCFFK